MGDATKRDALEDARGCLDGIGGFYDGDQGRDDRHVRALAASASAQIAIAEALNGIWHELEEMNVRLTDA
jgi:hypothetical protein